METRFAAPNDGFLQQVGEMETGMVQFHWENTSFVQSNVLTGCAYRQAKQLTTGERARRQLTLENTREEMADVIQQLVDWHTGTAPRQ